MAVRVTGMTGTGMVCTVGQKFWSIDFFTGYRAYNIKSLVFGHHICELLKLKKECCELFLLIFGLPIFTFEQVRVWVHLPKGQVDWQVNIYSCLTVKCQSTATVKIDLMLGPKC